MTTKKPAKKQHATDAPPQFIAVRVPEPGSWRPVESLGGKVLRYAWACPRCKRVEYVRCGNKGHDIEPGKVKSEHCPCMGERNESVGMFTIKRPNKMPIKDDRRCRSCDGTGLIGGQWCPKCKGAKVASPAEAGANADG